MAITYNDSWDSACTTVRAALITSAAAAFASRYGVPLLADKTFHLDFLPAKVFVAALYVGGGINVAHTWDNIAPQELVMDARIEARFDTRANARAFAMMMLAALPIRHTGNVVEFRLAGNPEIAADPLRLANDKGEQIYWKATIPCLAVFRTSEEYT